MSLCLFDARAYTYALLPGNLAPKLEIHELGNVVML